MSDKPGRFDYGIEDNTVKIDLKDKKILSYLEKNSRIPLTQIAKKVKLSRDGVSYRINRLVKEGIILKFFPNINYEKLGLYMFHVFFLVDEKDPKKKLEMIEYLKAHPNIFSLIEYTDTWDFEISIIARDLIEFDRIMLEICAAFPETILEKSKLELIRRFNSSHVPPLIHEQGNHTLESVFKRDEIVKIDLIDYKILELLCEDARISAYAIGEKLNISSDTVSYRIKNLEKKKIIKNFTILVNLSKMKYQWYTYSMEMKMFDLKKEKKFEEFLNQNLNIIRSAKTLGGWDLLLYLVVDNQRHFHLMIKDIKNVFSDVVKKYSTWVAYKEHIFDPLPDAIYKNIK
ncbi:MAG: AsnC family transcriptional regulator [Nanoarchaeota archaeon]|nr:AsnC family transcriptional regulator [Nanoarchaeota archaeon]MBU1269551.1 AsnC family transcriptional regulator [Nanoarchaeota archaeon]MBU1604717.1 AsnC family transcriptional regulator [Nanoarchaeota archaeon]MBU2443812.1 AsnC family transcriptional regulator [Nanoarchaeota archaeon]